jgi:hypothetical protein
LAYVVGSEKDVTPRELNGTYKDIGSDLYNTARLDNDILKTNNAQVDQLCIHGMVKTLH